MAEKHYKQELYPLSVVIATLGGETLADTISYLNSGEKFPTEILICIPEEESSCAESLSMKNVKIIKTSFIDKTDEKKRFVAVQVRFFKKLKSPVSLEKIKNNSVISHLPLIKQSRLSVMPIDYKSWKIICKMGKVR